MKHTPGPWTAKENAYNYWGVYSPNETLLAEAPFKYRPANIRLMAAAPEMVDLLRQAWLEMDNAVQVHIPKGEDGKDMAELCGKIEDLLNRIEGDEKAE